MLAVNRRLTWRCRIPQHGHVLYWDEHGLFNRQGGHADVIMGWFADGTRVAIKRLRHSSRYTDGDFAKVDPLCFAQG